MGEETRISWAHATFNPWWGCEKVSPACFHCYAERDALRYGHKVWGKKAPRRFFSDKYWMQPHRWDIEAKAAHERRRVFCASMADVFEAREDLDRWREKLWDLIDTTSGLDWLLLTKRPENIRRMVPPEWLDHPPLNVWYGTTVEDQEHAEKRIPELLRVPARVRFLSCEPLIGPVSLQPWLTTRLGSGVCDGCGRQASDVFAVDGAPLAGGALGAACCGGGNIHWVITGGESGPGARPADPTWYRQLRDQAVDAGVPFHFKQWGEWLPFAPTSPCIRRDEEGVLLEAHVDGKVYGPQSLLAFANHVHVRVGKKAAGRQIDGRIWDEAPETKGAQA